MPRILVHHRTCYRYARAVAFGDHHFQLRPREAFDQRLRSFHLTIEPEPMTVQWRLDPLGNAVGRARFGTVADRLLFDARFEIEQVATGLPELAALDTSARRFPPAYAPHELPDLIACMGGPPGLRQQHGTDGTAGGRRRPDDPVAAWTSSLVAERGPADAVAFLAMLTFAIKEGFTYARRDEAGVQTAAETLRLRRGTCRDFAVLFMAAARAHGFAARFVSGYVGARGRGDAPVGGGATHAWAQVYLNEGGWVDFDPTNAIVGNRGLVRVASVREPAQATPLWGTYFGDAGLSLGLEVDVRVTLLDGTEPAPAPPVDAAGTVPPPA